MDSVHTARAILLFPRSRRRSLEIDMGREPHGYLDNSPRQNIKQWFAAARTLHEPPTELIKQTETGFSSRGLARGKPYFTVSRISSLLGKNRFSMGVDGSVIFRIRISPADRPSSNMGTVTVVSGGVVSSEI